MSNRNPPPPRRRKPPADASPATSKRGGPRPGAGRPPSPDGRSERLSVRLTPRLVERLQASGRAGEIIEAALEFGDANRDGLPLSFLAEFVRAGRRYWPNAGDGTFIDGIPLGLTDAALRKGWPRQHDGDAPAIEEAYRRYGPLARRVLAVLTAANPLLGEADLDWRHERRNGTRVNTTRAIELLHAYALIVNDGTLPCGGRALVRFMWEQESGPDDPAHWISDALQQGRPDVAVAFGAGDYAVAGEAAVLARARSDLRSVDTALAWWTRCPEFCRKVDPDIERVAAIPELAGLAKLAHPLRHGLVGVMGRMTEADLSALRAFRAAWWPLAARHGEDTLLRLLERFDAIRADTARRLLAIHLPGEPQPTDHALLGLAPGATRQDIDKAFRRLAQKLHPDKGGDAAAFDRIRQARDRLVSG